MVNVELLLRFLSFTTAGKLKAVTFVTYSLNNIETNNTLQELKTPENDYCTCFNFSFVSSSNFSKNR